MDRTVGFVGLGMMGAPMAARLMNAGYHLRIFNRTKTKAVRLVERGAAWCKTPAEVALGANCVFTMLTNDDAVSTASLGSEGISSGLARGGIHIDCSTISPDIAAALEQHYAFNRQTFYQMPVLGGPAQAAEGTLLLFLGGDMHRHEEIEEFLPVLGKRVWRFPSARHATCTKLVCNSFISGLLVTLAQGLVFASKSGIGPKTLLEILEQSALNSSSLQRKGMAMIERKFAPSFFLENLLKDTNLMIETAQSLGIPVPMADIARDLLSEAVRLGFAKEDYSAAVKVLERSSGSEVKA